MQNKIIHKFHKQQEHQPTSNQHNVTGLGILYQQNIARFL